MVDAGGGGAARIVATGAGAVVADTGAVVGTAFALTAWCVGVRLGVAVTVGAVEALSACLAFPLTLAIPAMTMISAATLPRPAATL